MSETVFKLAWLPPLTALAPSTVKPHLHRCLRKPSQGIILRASCTHTDPLLWRSDLVIGHRDSVMILCQNTYLYKQQIISTVAHPVNAFDALQ